MDQEKLDKLDGNSQAINRDSAYSKVSKLPRKLLGSGFEKVSTIKQEFQSAWEASQENWNRLWEANKFMHAAPGEQWEEKAYRRKTKMGLRCAQYNIIGPKVHTAVGAVLADKYNFKYQPRYTKYNTTIDAISDAYYEDSEICNYDDEYTKFIQDGIVHSADMEVLVDDKYEPRGNIRFQRVTPGRLIWDPNWKTDTTGEDAEMAYKWGVYDLPTILRMYGSIPQTQHVQNEIQRIKNQGMQWEKWRSSDMDMPFPPQTSLFLVIERFWIEEVKTKRLMGRTEDGSWIPFPVTEDKSKLDQFATRNGINDWSEGVKIQPYKDKICKMNTICPELCATETIQEGKPEVQIQSLPFIHFTLERDLDGRDKGLVQDQIDPQKDMNYSKSKLAEYLAAGLGGAVVYSKNQMADESDRQDFEKNHNDPTRSFAVDGEPKAFFSRMVNADPPTDLVQQPQESIGINDRTSRVPASMSSEQKGANEPASLFAMKLKTARLGQWTIDQRVQNVRKRMADAYYKQAQISYAGSPRVIHNDKGERKTLNESITREGKAMIRNNVKYAPRVSVEVSEAPQNLTKQERERTELSAIIETVPPQYQETMLTILGQIIDTTSVGIEHKAELEATMAVEKSKARLRSILELKQLAMQIKQSEVVTLQTQQQLDMLMAKMDQQAQLAAQGGAEETAEEEPEESLTPAEGGGGATQQPQQQPQQEAQQPQPENLNQRSRPGLMDAQNIPAGLGI